MASEKNWVFITTQCSTRVPHLKRFGYCSIVIEKWMTQKFKQTLTQPYSMFMRSSYPCDSARRCWAGDKEAKAKGVAKEEAVEEEAEQQTEGREGEEEKTLWKHHSQNRSPPLLQALPTIPQVTGVIVWSVLYIQIKRQWEHRTGACSVTTLVVACGTICFFALVLNHKTIFACAVSGTYEPHERSFKTAHTLLVIFNVLETLL